MKPAPRRIANIPNARRARARERAEDICQGKCFFCDALIGADAVTYDHLIPRAKGGRTNGSNLVLSCRPCNAGKSDRLPTDPELEKYRLLSVAADRRRDTARKNS